MKKHSRPACVLLALSCVALGAALAFGWQYLTQTTPPPAPQISAAPAPEATPTPSPSLSPAPTDDPALTGSDLPRGKLSVSPARKAYAGGTLRLIIPKLGVEVPVLNGVDAQTLLQGIGLYDYAQLPGEEGANTSIAGHRNGLRGGKITDSMPFYYINTLTEGDYLYLRDGTSIYQYLWACTEVIAPDDWGPIYRRDAPCLTLTTCTPIGVADHRLVVRGVLVDTLPLDAAYPYPSNTAEVK